MSTFLPDVNVLLALSLPSHQHHRSATRWYSDVDSWATTPMTETAYLRLMSNPRVVGYDIAVDQVVEALNSMRSLPGHTFLDDATSLAAPVIDIRPLAGSSQVTDFHLVNLAAHRSVVLATFDAAMTRALAAEDRRHVHVLSD